MISWKVFTDNYPLYKARSATLLVFSTSAVVIEKYINEFTTVKCSKRSAEHRCLFCHVCGFRCNHFSDKANLSNRSLLTESIKYSEKNAVVLAEDGLKGMASQNWYLIKKNIQKLKNNHIFSAGLSILVRDCAKNPSYFQQDSGFGMTKFVEIRL